MAELRRYEPTLVDRIREAGTDVARAVGHHNPHLVGENTVRIFSVTPPGAGYEAGADLAAGNYRGAAVNAAVSAFGGASWARGVARSIMSRSAGRYVRSGSREIEHKREQAEAESSSRHLDDLHMQGGHAAQPMHLNPAELGRKYLQATEPTVSTNRSQAGAFPQKGSGVTLHNETPTAAETAQAESDEADARARESRGEFFGHYSWQNVRTLQKQLGAVAGIPGREAERDELVSKLAREHERLEALYDRATVRSKEARAQSQASASKAQQPDRSGDTFQRTRRDPRSGKEIHETVRKRRRVVR